MRLFTRFMRDDFGATMIETSLVFTLLILMTLGFVDLARAFAEWNAAEKATQIGVRAATITDPVDSALADDDCADRGVPLGKDCNDPNYSNPGFGVVVCTSSSCTGGNSPHTPSHDPTAFNTILSRMQVVYPKLTAAQLVIEYSDVKLGFAGRGNPVPAITVRLSNVPFDFIILNSLLGLPQIMLPGMAATLTGEDLTAKGTA